MDIEERKKWLKWSKMGICVPRQSEEPKEFTMEKSLENLLKRQEDMERNFNVYLRDAELKHGQTSERKTSKSGEAKRDNNNLIYLLDYEKVPLLLASNKSRALKVYWMLNPKAKTRTRGRNVNSF
jgi:hypothetical protein